jgi:hypothetical protein
MIQGLIAPYTKTIPPQMKIIILYDLSRQSLKILILYQTVYTYGLRYTRSSLNIPFSIKRRQFIILPVLNNIDLLVKRAKEK